MSKNQKPIEAHQFILNSPEPPLAQGEVRDFIMANPSPPPWGPEMEQEIRARLTADGFHVGRCQCLGTHPVVAIKLRGRPEMEIREMRRRIRKLAKDLGHRAPSGGLSITGEQIVSRNSKQPTCVSICSWSVPQKSSCCHDQQHNAEHERRNS
jgi:hypothetical protein